MSTSGGPSLVRRAAVYVLSACLAAGGLGLIAFATSNSAHARLPLHVPWWIFPPVYVLALQRPLEYEVKRETRMMSLTQIPMAIALVCIAPWWNVLGRTIAGVVDVAQRRQPPIKAVYNVTLGVAEVGVATSVLAAFTSSYEPRPILWLALAAAMYAVDVLSTTSIAIVLRLMSVRQTHNEIWLHLTTSFATTTIFTSLGILAIAAAWSDASTLAIIGIMALGLGLLYRRHRRLGQETQQAAELQQFLKGLGPLDLVSTDNRDVLEHVRDLLHTERIELSLRESGAWWTYIAVEGEPVVRELVDAATLESAGHMSVSAEDRMSSPMLHNGELVGVLTVRERMGSTRKFAMRDVRVLETVATELTKAVDRGHLQRQLALSATTDPLTGLANLSEVSRQIDKSLEDRSLVVAAVAVDSFREVNDTLGHEVGDELLIEVTRRLRLSYPDSLIGRIGGGRFAVTVPADTIGHDPSMFGLGIRAQVEGGAQLGPIGTHIRLSVGCVSAPEHGDDAATLIRRAETAMYGARHAHGGPVVWEPVYEVEGQRRLAVVMALREALSSGAIGVAFQPKVSAHSHEVTGVEALARWTHPALGAISPGEFVPLAEAAGLMGPLTSSVMRQALTACKGWQRRAARIGVAVNVSADTILDPNFVTEVAAILTSINISPDLLTLELTEGVVVADPQLASLRMSEVRALGVKISVDDFGTGYSSLTYLKGLPVDEVKIDKGFVDDIAHEAGDRAVVRAVVDIAHTLGLKVVAEGVEHVEQDRILAELGVDEVQGYLHARPMAALDVAQWLRRREDVGLPQQVSPRRSEPFD